MTLFVMTLVAQRLVLGLAIACAAYEPCVLPRTCLSWNDLFEEIRAATRGLYMYTVSWRERLHDACPSSNTPIRRIQPPLY